MILFSLALAQVVSSYVPETIDLTLPQPCRAGGADEVVVCANRNGENPYRLKQVPPLRKEGLPNAEAQIAKESRLAEKLKPRTSAVSLQSRDDLFEDQILEPDPQLVRACRRNRLRAFLEWLLRGRRSVQPFADAPCVPADARPWSRQSALLAPGE